MSDRVHIVHFEGHIKITDQQFQAARIADVADVVQDICGDAVIVDRVNLIQTDHGDGSFSGRVT